MNIIVSRKRVGRGTVAVAAIMVGVAVLAACSSSSSPKTSPVAAASAGPSVDAGAPMSTTAALAALYKRAMANKETTLIDTVNTGDTPAEQKMAALFNKTYPGITLKFKETPFLSMGSIVLSEKNSGQRTGDLVTNAFLELKPLIDAKQIDFVNWANLGVPAARITPMPGGDLGVVSDQSTCDQTIWNRKYVKDSQIPADIEAYTTDPQWKSLMVTWPENAYPCFGFRSLKYGTAHEVTFAKALKANGLDFSEGYSQLFSTGEKPVLLIGNSELYSQWKAQGIDVGEKFYPGSGIIQDTTAVVKNTPVPDAAELWALWLTTPAASALKEQVSPGSGFTNDPKSIVGQEYAANPGLFVQETAANYELRTTTSVATQKAITGS